MKLNVFILIFCVGWHFLAARKHHKKHKVKAHHKHRSENHDDRHGHHVKNKGNHTHRKGHHADVYQMPTQVVEETRWHSFPVDLSKINIKPENCINRLQQNECEYKSRHGYCSYNFYYMLDNCPLACRFCTRSIPKTKERCEDKSWKCPAWAHQKDCLRFPKYMKENCNRSCLLCGKDSNGVMKFDNSTLCPTWSSVGYCSINEQVRERCPHSCDVYRNRNLQGGLNPNYPNVFYYLPFYIQYPYTTIRRETPTVPPTQQPPPFIPIIPTLPPHYTTLPPTYPYPSSSPWPGNLLTPPPDRHTPGTHSTPQPHKATTPSTHKPTLPKQKPTPPGQKPTPPEQKPTPPEQKPPIQMPTKQPQLTPPPIAGQTQAPIKNIPTQPSQPQAQPSSQAQPSNQNQPSGKIQPTTQTQQNPSNGQPAPQNQAPVQTQQQTSVQSKPPTQNQPLPSTQTQIPNTNTQPGQPQNGGQTYPQTQNQPPPSNQNAQQTQPQSAGTYPQTQNQPLPSNQNTLQNQPSQSQSSTQPQQYPSQGQATTQNQPPVQAPQQSQAQPMPQTQNTQQPQNQDNQQPQNQNSGNTDYPQQYPYVIYYQRRDLVNKNGHESSSKESKKSEIRELIYRAKMGDKMHTQRHRIFKKNFKREFF